MDMDSPRLAVDGRCDARVSCGDETSEVRGTRSECRVLGSSRAVAVTDVGRVRVCGSTAFADRRVAIARVKRKVRSIFDSIVSAPSIFDLVAGVRWMADLSNILLSYGKQSLKKSRNGHQRPFSVKNLKNRPRFFFFFFRETNEEQSSRARDDAGVSKSAFSFRVF